MANENSLELKVSLRVNESLPDIRKQLDQLESKLRTLKLNATLDIGKSTPIINQKIDKLTNSVKKINLVAGLDFAKSKDNINKTIKKLDNNVKIKGNVELDSNKIIKAKKEVTSLNKLLKSSGKYDLGIKGNSIKEVKDNVRKTFADAGKDVFYNLDSQLKQLKNKGYQIKIELNGGSVKKLSNDLKSIENQINKIQVIGKNDSQTIIPYKANTTKGTEVNGYVVDKTISNDTEYKNLQANIDKTRVKLQQLLDQNKLTTDSFNNFNKSLNTVKNNNALDKLNKDIDITNKRFSTLSANKSKINSLVDSLNKLNMSSGVKGNSQFDNLKKELSSLQNDWLKLENALNNGKGINGNQFNLLNNKIESAKTKINEFKNSFSKINKTNTLDLDISQFQKKMELAIKTLQQSKSHNLNNNEVDSFLKSVNELSSKTPNARQEMSKLNTQFKEMSVNAKQVNSDLQNSLKSMAMWSVATTAFWTPIRAIQSMTSEILEFDKQMTNIRRVMDEPSYKYEEMLQDTFQISNELGVSAKNTLSIIEQFAKQNYKGDDLLDLSKTAETLETLSDLNPEQTVNTLTSALVNFNMTAKESTKVGDMLNEVDNQYAVSTLDLSDSIRKASSVSSTFGVDLEHLLAMTTATAEATRESGSVIGNGLKSIFARITTNDSAISALKEVGISITDLQGKVKPVQDIIQELSKKWNNLTDAQRQNTSAGVAGIYQIGRFSALMNNYSRVLDVVETAENSAGSMQREHAKYMESYEARLNQLSNAWSNFSLSVGKAFLNSGLDVGIASLNSLTIVATKAVNIIGALPIVLGTAGTALSLLTKNSRTLTTALTLGTFGMDKTRLKAVELSKDMSRAEVATTLLKRSLKGLGIASGIGLAFGALGWVIEQLTNKYAENKRVQEELESENKQFTESYKQNSKEIDSLAQHYNELQKIIDSGNYDSSTMKDYLDTQSKLAELLPSLKTGEDNYGNSLVGNASIVQARIDLTKQQLAVQKELNAEKEKEKTNDRIDTATDEYDDANKKKSNILNMASVPLNGLNYIDPSTEIKSLNDLEDAIKRVKKAKDDAKEHGATDDELKQYDLVVKGLKNAEVEYGQYENKAKSALLTIRDENLKTLDSTLKSNDNISKSNKETISKIFSTATLNADSDKSLKAYDNMVKSISSNKDMINAMNDFSNVSDKVTNATSDDFNKVSKEAKKSFKSIKDEILNASGLDNDSDAYKELAKSIDIAIASELNNEKSARKLANQKNISIEQARNQIAILGDETDSVNGLSDTMKDYVDNLNKLSSTEENIVGTSQAKVDETNSLINTYQALGAEVSIYEAQLKNKNLTDEESTSIQTALNGVISNRSIIEEKLYALYPEFIKKTKDGINLSADKIKMIKQEAEANDVLLKAYALASDGKLSTEGIATMGSLQSTNARIKNINTEIEALDKLQQAYRNQMETYASQINSGKYYGTSEGLRLEKNYMLAQQALNRAKSISKSRKAEYATLSTSQKNYTSSLQSTINSINTNTSSTNKNTKSKKSNNSETTKSIYLTDKYKQYIDKLNSAMNKQEKIVSRYPTWSKAYRNALKEQIKLKQKEIDKTKEQYALLKKQIKNGTIYQTGTVNVKVKKSSVSKASNASTASLGYTGKYSSLIKKYAKQYGVNPNLIAAIIKQESAFNAKAISPAGAKGLMQLMPATARSLGVKNSYDPSQNIKGGTKYIAQMLKKYGGNIEKALRAYNAGSGNLAKSYGFAETNKYVKNVTSNFNSYLKKAGGNITKVSTSAIKNMEATVKKTTTRKLAGWSGQITQGYGGKNGHLGVDIDGKKGQRLESNVNGKVKFAGKGTGVNKSYGNYVVVTGSNGKSYLYAHLDATSVKKGQTVKVGQKIGEIGNTGNVVKGKGGDGSHLHYEVRDKNGNRINPLSSVKYAKQNRTVTTSKTVSTKGVVTKSKQALDDAKQTLKDLYDLVVNDNADIAEYRQAIIDSYLESYDRKVDFHEKKKSNRAISKERSVGDSDWYRKAVENDITNTKYEIKYTKQKQAYIKKLMKSKSITPAEKAKLGDQLDEIKQQLNQYTSDLIASRSEYIGSRISEYDYDIELKDRNINRQENLQGLMNNTSKQYTKSLASEKQSAKEKAKLLRSELNYATVQSKYLKNGYKEMRKQKEKADEIKNAIIENDKKLAEIANKEYDSKLNKNNNKVSDYDYLLNRSQVYADSLFDGDPEKYKEFGNQIALRQKELAELVKNNDVLYDALKDPDLTSEIKQQRKQELEDNKMKIVNLESEVRNMYKDTADYVIDLYKQVYEQRRDLEIKAIDEERERYQKLINDKIDALQKANEEEDHQDEVNDYQKRISDLEKRIKQFTGDDSRVGIYEKKKAEDELSDLQKEYEKFMRDYETQNKIDAWQDDLENKENELDDATEDTNKYFDNLVNDEREFNKIRQQILDGNIKSFKDSLSGMDDFINENMDDIGVSIAQNISDQIKNAFPQLDELVNNYDTERNNNVTSTPNNAPPITDNYNGTSTTPSSDKITTIKTTNLYKSKSTKSTVLIKIPKGTTLTYSSYASEWYKVTYKKKTGYVYRPDLQKTTTKNYYDPDTKALTKTTTVTDANGFISKSTVTTATNSNLLNTKREYDAKGNVTKTDYAEAKTRDDIKYLGKPDKDTKPLGTMKKGSTVEVTAVGDYYAKVIYKGKTVYVPKSKLQKLKTGGYTGDDVPESGALALLHKKELVLNEQQTKHILEASKMFKQNTTIPNTFAKFKPQSNIVTNEGSKINQIDKLINIEQFNGTEMDYKKMQNEMLKVMRKYGFSR